MAKKFQMLEDLERIIDSGYGESTGELEDEILEAVNAQKLRTLFTSFVQLAKDSLGEIKSNDVSGALLNLAFMVDSIGQSILDAKIKKAAGKLREAILALAGEGEPSAGRAPASMESVRESDKDDE